MRAAEVIKDKKYGAVVGCLGNDISTDFNARNIEIAGERFEVEKFSVVNSASDILVGFMILNEKNPKKIPLGTITVID